ncbi:hypothetical protein PLIIFM63780_002966 [Purpureocillium lilacinum]|nr:hypothetical protein PLIIFM63780_002966 [Purpureocillium lilacinum]
MCEDLHNVTVCELCARETPHRESVPKWCPVARLRSHFGLCDFGAQYVELKHAGTCRRCRRGVGVGVGMGGMGRRRYGGGLVAVPAMAKNGGDEGFHGGPTLW